MCEIRLLRPPYEPGGANCRTKSPHDATLTLLQPTSPMANAAAVLEAIWDYRKQNPFETLALVCGAEGRADDVLLAAAGFVGAFPLHPNDLRRHGGAAARLRMFPLVDDEVRRVVRLASPLRIGHTASLCAALGGDGADEAIPSSLRKALRGYGLPAPSRWYRLVDALRLATAIQRSPHVPLEKLAFAFSFGDQSSLSRHLVGMFGLRPGRLRGTVGWAWLVRRFMVRMRVGVGVRCDSTPDTYRSA